MQSAERADLARRRTQRPDSEGSAVGGEEEVWRVAGLLQDLKERFTRFLYSTLLRPWSKGPEVGEEGEKVEPKPKFTSFNRLVGRTL